MNLSLTKKQERALKFGDINNYRAKLRLDVKSKKDVDLLLENRNFITNNTKFISHEEAMKVYKIDEDLRNYESYKILSAYEFYSAFIGSKDYSDVSLYYFFKDLSKQFDEYSKGSIRNNIIEKKHLIKRLERDKNLAFTEFRDFSYFEYSFKNILASLSEEQLGRIQPYIYSLQQSNDATNLVKILLTEGIFKNIDISLLRKRLIDDLNLLRYIKALNSLIKMLHLNNSK